MAPDIGASAAGSDIGLNTATNPRCRAPTSSQIRTTLAPGCRETVTVPTQYSPCWFLPSIRVHYGAAALEFRFTFVLSIYGSVGRGRAALEQRTTQRCLLRHTLGRATQNTPAAGPRVDYYRELSGRLRCHSSSASLNWTTNTWRGSPPSLAAGEHMYRAA